MWRYIVISAVFLLAVSACASGADPVSEDVSPNNDYETTGESAAQGLTPGERESVPKRLANDPQFEETVEREPVYRSIREFTREAWDEATNEQRIYWIHSLARYGNPWARQVMYELRRGWATEDGLAKLGPEVELEVERERYRAYEASRGSGGYDGVEPMPFGESMHGPWNTGRGPAGR